MKPRARQHPPQHWTSIKKSGLRSSSSWFSSLISCASCQYTLSSKSRVQRWRRCRLTPFSCLHSYKEENITLHWKSSAHQKIFYVNLISPGWWTTLWQRPTTMTPTLISPSSSVSGSHFCPRWVAKYLHKTRRKYFINFWYQGDAALVLRSLDPNRKFI